MGCGGGLFQLLFKKIENIYIAKKNNLKIIFY